MKDDSEKILLSVVVPIGNMVGNLQFIESWLHNVKNYSLEVILVLDQTFLNVGPELEELLQSVNSSKVILIHGIFGDPGSARNAGLGIATGSWIGFWDSDDSPNVKNIFAAIEISQEYDEILVGNFSVLDIKTMKYRTPIKNVNGINSVAMNPGIWRMIFRIQTICDTKFPNLKMGEDQVFLAHLNFGMRKLRFVESIFYQYNVGGTSQLTRSTLALKDLPLASSIILEHAKVAQRKQSIFDMQLVFRQQITIMKKGDILLKFSIFKFIRKYFKKFSFTFLTESVIALTRILRTITSAAIK
jgi:glycosyltransferase involved in cell wall biosynthesis